jgi:hypothetical protein
MAVCLANLITKQGHTIVFFSKILSHVSSRGDGYKSPQPTALRLKIVINSYMAHIPEMCTGIYRVALKEHMFKKIWVVVRRVKVGDFPNPPENSAILQAEWGGYPPSFSRLLTISKTCVLFYYPYQKHALFLGHLVF